MAPGCHCCSTWRSFCRVHYCRCKWSVFLASLVFSLRRLRQLQTKERSSSGIFSPTRRLVAADYGVSWNIFHYYGAHECHKESFSTPTPTSFLATAALSSLWKMAALSVVPPDVAKLAKHLLSLIANNSGELQCAPPKKNCPSNMRRNRVKHLLHSYLTNRAFKEAKYRQGIHIK